MKKIKVMTLGDIPLAFTGVSGQSRYFIEGLLKTGKFSVVSLGGAIKHQSYQPIKFKEFGDDWVIYPVDGFGNADVVRSLLRTERPDIVWLMSDPRFYEWLWQIENEIRPLCPIVYYTIWDNYPTPHFNRKFYLSNDVLVPISKVTENIVREVAPEVMCERIPHAVDTNIFCRKPLAEIENVRKATLGENFNPDTKIFFWNNRNARRKHSVTLIYWFGELLKKIGRDKAILIMHTDPRDENGTNIDECLKAWNLTNGEVRISNQKISPEQMSVMYNLADCTINIADAEGFGLSSLESLACETPVISTKTGGLQEQATDGIDTFGVLIEPSSKMLVGSQLVYYIYEDRISQQDFDSAMMFIINASRGELAKLGQLGRRHVLNVYNFDDFNKSWEDLLLRVHAKFGSWETRTGYKNWELKKIV